MAKKILLCAAVFTFLGALVGGYAGFRIAQGDFARTLALAHSIREGKSNYSFINPLLACELPQIKGLDAYAGIEDSLNALIAEDKKAGKVNDVSAYVIRNGHWMGINENAKYEPASLLKVVLMIAYLKKSEDHPELLTQKLPYTKEIENLGGNIPYQAISTLTVGSSYQIDGLIDKMIIESDNAAMNILLGGIEVNTLTDVYTDLGIDSPDKITGTYTISAKSYSLFFRILYNATYLNQKNSERALALLSKAKFDDGLVAGLPKEAVVSHKYGERVLTAGDGTITGVELHDCGFIYPKKNGKPYFLCVMTKGSTLAGAEQTIKDISTFVYGQLQK